MKDMEIKKRRPFSPNVKMVSKGVFQQFVTLFRAGLGLGLMLFVALTTFSVLNHGANLIEVIGEARSVEGSGTGF